MYRGFKVVACIPAGRKRVMELNLMHLRAQQGFLDGVMLWHNTDDRNDPEDDPFIEAQADDFVSVVPLDDFAPPLSPKQLNTGRFYRYTTEPGTIYIRLDDDIVWQHPDALRNLCDFRIEHPEFLVVFATIWNNAVCSALQWEAGHLESILATGERVNRYCMDPVGWKDGEFAVRLHNLLLDHIDAGTTEELYVPSIVAKVSDGSPLRFSVSCFAWFGEDWAVFDGDLKGEEEELWISVRCPEKWEVRNAICGNALVAHYSFVLQRPTLDQTDILDHYRKLAEARMHDAYYDILLANEDWTPFEVTPWWG